MKCIFENTKNVMDPIQRTVKTTKKRMIFLINRFIKIENI